MNRNKGRESGDDDDDGGSEHGVKGCKSTELKLIK